MGQLARRLIGKVGMALGIVVIVGSVVGGVVLAADLGRADDQTETGVPVSNEGAVPPSDTATASETPVPPSEPAPTVSTPPPDGAPTSAHPEGPATTRAPEPTPTCWEGDGERPDGIEKCEDDD